MQHSFVQCGPRASVIFAACASLVLGGATFLFLGVSDDNGASALEASARHGKYKPVVKLEYVMEGIDSIFDQLEDKLETKKFKTLRKRFLFIAEMMNLVGYFDHKEFSDEEGWEKFADKARGICLEAAAAAKKKDEAACKSFIKKIDDACESCHDVYQ